MHGLDDAIRAMTAARSAYGRSVTLLSAEAAACFAGAPWWMGLVAEARRRLPEVACRELLDCGDSADRALEALRLGARALVLREPDQGTDPGSAGRRAALMARATALDALVLPERPAALDLAAPDAARALPGWLDGGAATVQGAEQRRDPPPWPGDGREPAGGNGS
ncbi:MAG: hypothetical protein INR65_17280 [Gluconacetobacter diazotrophicus]|nr:hypothetical protein [Gluconacetobacter diazotrophicus]